MAGVNVQPSRPPNAVSSALSVPSHDARAARARSAGKADVRMRIVDHQPRTTIAATTATAASAPPPTAAGPDSASVTPARPTTATAPATARPAPGTARPV